MQPTKPRAAIQRFALRTKFAGLANITDVIAVSILIPGADP